jgi:hypothetical protein
VEARTALNASSHDQLIYSPQPVSLRVAKGSLNRNNLHLEYVEIAVDKIFT